MKLAFITQDFPPDLGGIQTYSYEIAKRIWNRFDDFILIAPDKASAAKIDNDLPFKIHRVQTKNALLGLKGIPEVLPLLKKMDIDCTFHAQWPSLGISFAARKAGIVEYTAVAAHAREFYFNPYGPSNPLSNIYEAYKHKLLAVVDFFFPVSHFTAALLEDYGIHSEEMKVIINGTNPDLFFPLEVNDLRQKLDLKGKKIITTITRLIERKAVDTVLRALALLKGRVPDIHYVIVGEGPFESKLKELAHSLEIENLVSFIGSIPYEKVNKYYNLCDVYVMPSKTMLPEVEAFGIAFLEANACGKPAIDSRTGGISDAVLDGKTGLLVEEQNPRELADAIERLLSNESLKKKMGNNGRKRVLEEANWDVAAQSIFSKIKEMA